MAHFSENVKTLEVVSFSATNQDELFSLCKNLSDVCLLVLPTIQNLNQLDQPLQGIGSLIAEATKNLSETATLVVLGEIVDLVQVQAIMPATFMYQHWIAIKRETLIDGNKRKLPHQHYGALVYTKYKAPLRHTKTRIEYTYCPICNKTTKDYGGKKHTYHEAGTLISDVWKDFTCDLSGDLSLLIRRFAELFGLEPYKFLTVLDLRQIDLHRLTDRKSVV